MWTVINKVHKCTQAAPVQPLKRTDGDFDFDYSEIANRLEKVHIVNDHKTSTNGENNWTNQVIQYIESSMKEEKPYLKHPQHKKEAYNQDIKIQEIKAEITTMNKDCSPGPDNIHPLMIINTENMEKPLLTLFQLCWYEGKVPSAWKHDNRIYI